jgi:GMP synthase-like glutamine amidotransferase
MEVLDAPSANRWFGKPRSMTVYHWHRESFELPEGAELLASNAACPHQAFAIGPHLAMQFHVELDQRKLDAWSASVDPEYLSLQRTAATVQSGAQMREQARDALAAQQGFADSLYRRWLSLD